VGWILGQLETSVESNLQLDILRTTPLAASLDGLLHGPLVCLDSVVDEMDVTDGGDGKISWAGHCDERLATPPGLEPAGDEVVGPGGIDTSIRARGFKSNAEAGTCQARLQCSFAINRRIVRDGILLYLAMSVDLTQPQMHDRGYGSPDREGPLGIRDWAVGTGASGGAAGGIRQFSIDRCCADWKYSVSNRPS
jgi:hypothetical protein